MARKIAEAIVRGILIHFRKRRVIEDEFDERIDRAACLKNGHAQVNQLGRALTEDLDAEQFFLSRRKISFSIPVKSPTI